MEGFNDQNIQNSPQTPVTVNAENTITPEIPQASAQDAVDMGAPGAAPSSPIFGNNDGRAEYMNPVFMSAPPVNEPPRKKIKAWPIVAGILALVLIGGGIILFVMRDVIANSMAKAGKTPEEYLAYVVDKQPWDKLNKTYDEAYKQAADLEQMKMEGEIRFNMSDDMLEVVEAALEDAITDSRYYYYYSPGNGIDLRLDAWQDIAFKFETERADNGLSAMQAIQLKDKDYLLSMEEMYDTDKSTVYLRSPQLNEDYAAVKLTNFLKDDEMEIVNGILDSGKNGLDALPTPQMLDNMRGRYISAIIEQIEDVDMDDDVLTINGQDMKCTVLSFNFDEDMQKETILALIDAVRNDDDLEDMVYNLLKESGKSMNMDPDEVWDSIMDELDKAEDSIENYKSSFEPDICIYVDNKGNIVGLSMEESKDILLMGYIRKGTKVWAEMRASSGKKDLFSLSGEGKAGVSGLDMDCMLTVNADDEFEIPFSIENLSDKGGTFRMDLEPVFDIIRDNSHDSDLEDILDILEGELVMTSQRNDTEVTSSMSIEKKGKTQIGISSELKLSKASDIEFPGSKETVKISSAIEVMPYLGDCDIEKLADCLEKLGMPKDYADEVRDSADMLKYY